MSQTLSPKLTGEVGQTDLLATFFVREALCALDAGGIQEVIRIGALTPVRHAPAAVAGIVNLRGKIVTVLDLGLRVGFAPIVPSAQGRIFIMEDRNEFIGLLVDRVDEVLEIDPAQLQPPPANISPREARFLKGICRAGNRVITLLDTAAVLGDCDAS
jgi:purine-binding chemotaxis protein CheW